MFLLEMDLLSRVLMLLFLFTAMLSIGLQTTAGDLRSLLRSRGLFVRSLLANFVVVPIVGIVLVKTLPLKPEAATALLLLACTPGGISALQFTTKIKGASLCAGSNAFLLSIVAVFLSPALLTLVLPADVSVGIPYGRALLWVLVYMLLPLVAGTLMRSRAERLAEKLSKPCAIVSAILFVVVLVLIMGWRKDAMSAVGREALLYMLLFVVISMAVGWFMGGPAQETRMVLATVTGMRHVVLCLIIALNTFPDPAMQRHLVAFSALMVPPNTLLTAYMIIRSRKSGGASRTDGG
jgi:bile acid:Na+ symporter, BASS family